MRILIADDHALFVEGISLLLKRLEDKVDIKTSLNVEQTIELLESQEIFDLILIDLNMPGMNGLSILQRMQAKEVLLPLVVISSEENAHTIHSVLKAGALGFIPKSHNSQQMLDALHFILNGNIYVPDNIQKQINMAETQRPPEAAANNEALLNAGISARQYDVLKLLAEGYSNKQIALTLFLTEHTVKSHLKALFKSLNAANRTDCVKAALEQDLLSS